jgi:hypothetical protein
MSIQQGMSSKGGRQIRRNLKPVSILNTRTKVNFSKHLNTSLMFAYWEKE